MFCVTLRTGCASWVRIAVSSSSRKMPSRTSCTLSSSTPSSLMCFENGGIEPGVMPPMSA